MLMETDDKVLLRRNNARTINAPTSALMRRLISQIRAPNDGERL